MRFRFYCNVIMPLVGSVCGFWLCSDFKSVCGAVLMLLAGIGAGWLARGEL